MSLVEKVSALLEGLNRRDVERLTTKQRKKLAWDLRSIADLADPQAFHTRPRTAGVLAQLETERAS